MTAVITSSLFPTNTAIRTEARTWCLLGKAMAAIGREGPRFLFVAQRRWASVRLLCYGGRWWMHGSAGLVVAALFGAGESSSTGSSSTSGAERRCCRSHPRRRQWRPGQPTRTVWKERCLRFSFIAPAKPGIGLFVGVHNDNRLRVSRPGSCDVVWGWRWLGCIDWQAGPACHRHNVKERKEKKESWAGKHMGCTCRGFTFSNYFFNYFSIFCFLLFSVLVFKFHNSFFYSFLNTRIHTQRSSMMHNLIIPLFIFIHLDKCFNDGIYT
jgi:hypothetical protein